MAPRILVDSQIECGKQLIQELDARSVRVDAAFWMFNADSQGYQLIIGSDDVDSQGARPLYREIQEALKALPPDQRVSFSDIMATANTTSVVTTFSTSIRTSPEAIESIRVSNRPVNRQWIDDAYIYRMNVPQTPKHSSPPAAST